MTRVSMLVVALLFVVVTIGGGLAGYLSVEKTMPAPVVSSAPLASDIPLANEAKAQEMPSKDIGAGAPPADGGRAAREAAYGPDWSVCAGDDKDPHKQLAACERVLAMSSLKRPDRSLALNNRGTAFHELQDVRRAAASYMEAIKVDPKNSIAATNLGWLAMRFGRPREALKLADQSISNAPDRALGHCLKSRALEVLGKPDAALAVLQRMPPQVAEASCVVERYGNLYAATGDADKAIEYLRRVDTNPEKASAAQCQVGALLWQQGRKEESLAAYMKGVDLNPDNKCAIKNVAKLIYQMRPVSEVVAVLDRSLARHPDMIELRCYKAAAFEKEDGEKALKLYEEILAQYPTEKCSLFRRAWFMSTLGDREGALAAFDDALRAYPGDLDGWDGRARVNYFAGRSEEAIEDLSNALKLDAAAIGVRIRRGNTFQIVGRHDAAIGDYERVLALDPDHRETRRYLAEARLAMGKASATVAACREVLAADSSDAHGTACRLLLGQALLMQSRQTEAVRELESLAAESGEGSDASLHLVAIYLLSGNEARAREILGGFRSAKPRDPYGALWEILMMPEGGRAPADIQAMIAQPDIWPQPLLQHALGRIDDQLLRAAVVVPDFKLTSVRELEMAFYLGVRSFLAGDPRLTLEHFRSVRKGMVVKLNKNSYPALYRHSNQMEVVLAGWFSQARDSQSAP